MIQATAVEKRFFPWGRERFVAALANAIERLHWQDCQLFDAFMTARQIDQIQLGNLICPLQFNMSASWREIGNGVELVLSITETENSWSTIECKKRCRVLLDVLCEPLFPRQSGIPAAPLKS